MHEETKSNPTLTAAIHAAFGSPPFALEIDGTPIAKVPFDDKQDAVASLGVYLWFESKYRCTIGARRLPEEEMAELPWFTTATDVKLPEEVAAAIAANIASPPKRVRKARTKRPKVHVVEAGALPTGPRAVKPWPEHVRCAPSCIVRCGIFSPVGEAGGYHRKMTTLVTTKGLKVSIQGTQLLESDFDVFLGALHLSRREPEGSLLRVTLVDMIAACGRSDGSRTRDNLDSAIRRLQRSRVSIHDLTFDVQYEGTLLEGVTVTGAGKPVMVTFRVPAGFYELMRGKTSKTYIDVLDRQTCAGRPLAAWMQAFVASHSHPLPYSRPLYRGLTGLDCPQFTFNRQHKVALDYLKDKGIILDHWVNVHGNVAIVARARPSKSTKPTGATSA
jgi:hypothetical protein